MSQYEINDNILQFLGVVAQAFTVWATYYFTSQLVKNDNQREKRTHEDRLREKFKSYLSKFIDQGSGVIQGAGVNLVRKYKEDRNLIFDAYEELEYESKKRIPSLLEFKQLIRKTGEKID